ncbi:methyl-coenzyme M reductase operon protein D [Methanobacterium ferruginis]|uniref:methyl-coenzyme M reductase operon protein D n=1 Tax=Methanobacterium ferruginis TaxID=710191 RepID=UPI00257223B7|nr:methyl-coenzyme M reductase operon protein D [Methanobacterium ferruginis]BDZ66992.1 methyl-coenzyme M reductase [Methanobacterium ferruginis]
MDIEIFPHRLLSADTTEKLLKDLEKIEGIERIVLQGQRLPPEESRHPDRKTITIKGAKIDLQIKTGRVLMEIRSEEIIENIKSLCDNHLPFGFNIHQGTYIRKKKTVSDGLKYGAALDEIPDEMVGLTDQNAKLCKRATIIKK